MGGCMGEAMSQGAGGAQGRTVGDSAAWGNASRRDDKRARVTGGGVDRGAGPGRGRNRGARAGQQDVVLFDQTSVDVSCMSHVVVCVDDTDDISGDTSTGFVAEAIARCAVACGGRVSLGITRHQLLLAEGVPYTSHNSAMCFAAWIPPDAIDDLLSQAVEAIGQLSAPAADPGLCVAVLPEGFPDHLELDAVAQLESLCAFGQRAQQVICTKAEAYALAENVSWVRLSEHGGTGDGVIGALAGVGLRLGGNDGRFRGKWDLARICQDAGNVAVAGAGQTPEAAGESRGGQKASFEGAARSASEAGTPGGACASPEAGMPGGEGCSDADAPDEMRMMRADALCAHLAGKVAGEVLVVDGHGAPVPPDALVALVREAKPVLHCGSLAFVADMCDGVAVVSQKVDLGGIGAGEGWQRVCGRFAFDNDAEECAPRAQPSCRNCLYRRWTPRGFTCVAAAE